jgi:CheY-like chemotaxis protein
MVSLMIVDDSDEVRRLLRAVVADIAAPIFECSDGEAACARTRRIDGTGS